MPWVIPPWQYRRNLSCPSTLPFAAAPYRANCIVAFSALKIPRDYINWERFNLLNLGRNRATQRRIIGRVNSHITRSVRYDASE